MKTNARAFFHKRGFNLIEAAIVLGVIGLVIGGIWVAASAVRDNLRLNDITKDIALLYNNLTNTYSQQRPVAGSPVLLYNSLELVRILAPPGRTVEMQLGRAIINIDELDVSVAAYDSFFLLFISFPNPNYSECPLIANHLRRSFMHLSPPPNLMMAGTPNIQGTTGDEDLSTPEQVNLNCPNIDGISLFLAY